MTYRSRLYLDVDGVLNADHTPPFPETAQKAVFVNHSGGMKSKFWMNYAPEVITRLDALREDHDVELVWLTTWCEDEHVLKLPAAFRGLWNGRIAFVDALPASSDDKRVWTQWKVDAVVEETTRNPLPFSWVDDEAPEFHREVAEALPVPGLVIATDPRTGLTRDNLDALEAFHSNLPAAG